MSPWKPLFFRFYFQGYMLQGYISLLQGGRSEKETLDDSAQCGKINKKKKEEEKYRITKMSAHSVELRPAPK